MASSVTHNRAIELLVYGSLNELRAGLQTHILRGYHDEFYERIRALEEQRESELRGNSDDAFNSICDHEAWMDAQYEEGDLDHV
jgi:hypothetical protein